MYDDSTMEQLKFVVDTLTYNYYCVKFNFVFQFLNKIGLHFGGIHFVHELHFVPVDPKTKQLRRSQSHEVLKERVKKSRLH